ncbi:hypothetical protein ARMSODRAFT_1067125 [Armillaria solidipes]|uniref:Uncharacterized protein n=1 Tax=Armillaria solidipes TaxID=1076256 RepID=A0A2H3C9M8_9AGAR|nr:hypothetical protein ARMSODRAFT_1067125 [Armillaria solidipes]
MESGATGLSRRRRLLLEEIMTSVPKVCPGDTVFWHGREGSHWKLRLRQLLTRRGLKAPFPFMYIQRFLPREAKGKFLKAVAPPDFPAQTKNENSSVAFGKVDDILDPDCLFPLPDVVSYRHVPLAPKNPATVPRVMINT